MADLIDRQAAIDALGERPMVWVESDYELGARNQYDADVLAIETVPSAQPEWKRGKWIRQDNKGKPFYGWYQCSECGAVIGGKVNFCSECGADMREVDDE